LFALQTPVAGIHPGSRSFIGFLNEHQGSAEMESQRSIMILAQRMKAFVLLRSYKVHGGVRMVTEF
jgi:hypothetical protein